MIQKLKAFNYGMLFVALFCFQTIALSAEVITPSEVAYFDLDETGVNRRKQVPYIPKLAQEIYKYGKIALWEAPNKTKVLKTLLQLRKDRKENPVFFKNIQKLDGDDAIDAFAKRYPTLQDEIRPGFTIADRIKEVYSSGTPIQEVQKIMLDLQKNNVEVGIATNVGTKVVERLIANKTLLPINGIIFTANCAQNKPGQNGICTKKPDPEYFIYLAEATRKRGFMKKILFVDDKKENIEAANKNGNFIGIHYNGNATKLRKDILKAGFLPKQEIK